MREDSLSRILNLNFIYVGGATVLMTSIIRLLKFEGDIHIYVEKNLLNSFVVVLSVATIYLVTKYITQHNYIL